MKLKTTLLIFFTFFFCTLSLAAEALTFSGGYTKMDMQEGHQIINLSDGAQVKNGSLSIQAQSIQINGDDYSFLTCTNTVIITDTDKGMTLRTNKITYDRTNDLIESDSFIEIDNTDLAFHVTAHYLNYNVDKGTMELQVDVKLYHDAEGKLMACQADSLSFDLTNKILILLGNATVDYDANNYQAQAITIDLNTNAIKMDGNIKGTIDG